MTEENFGQVFDRRNTDCAKWDEMDENYGRHDLIHLGVADMDFQAPEPIRSAFSKIIEHGIFGYTNVSDNFYSSVQWWLKRQIGEEIPREWIVFCPRINISSSVSVASLTASGDKVIMHAPFYMPLHDAVEKNGRVILESPLKLSNEKRYEMDFSQMEDLVDDRTRMVILCHPHNPCGRSWDRQELETLADFCSRHDLLLFSDEIHSDIRPRDVKFTSTLNIGGRLKDRLIYVNSPTKTFNIPGVILSYMIIPNPDIRAKVMREIDRIGMHNPTVFANAAVTAGYRECDSWLQAVNDYIDGNERFVRDYIGKYMPAFHIHEREGTYLLWIDCQSFNKSDEMLEKWFIEEAGVAVYMGRTFGSRGKGFIRWNLGSPRSVQKEALVRMNHVYSKLEKEREI